MEKIKDSEINVQHKQDYDAERLKRWSLAENQEEPAIIKLCHNFINILKIKQQKIAYLRYDKIWFEKYPIEKKENQWVKGCPDFCIRIANGGENYLYIEVKLKCIEFQKTIRGGVTKNKSVVTEYGCTSFYLDIEPVYGNMKRFSDRAKLNPGNFLIMFIKEDYSEIRIISLMEVNQLVLNGWQDKPLCKFGEGYGQNTYLIPKNATISLANLNILRLLSYASDQRVFPLGVSNLEWKHL